MIKPDTWLIVGHSWYLVANAEVTPQSKWTRAVTETAQRKADYCLRRAVRARLREIAHLMAKLREIENAKAS